MSVVAPGHHADFLWFRVLLRGGRHPFHRKLRWSCWRDIIASNFGLSMFHVAQDEEAKDLFTSLGAELGAGNRWNGSKCASDCGWCVCYYSNWY